MRRKKLVSLLLISSLVLALGGCGTESRPVNETAQEEIELVDPVSAEVSYEEAARRTLYDSSVYAATVVPYIEEYTTAGAITFGSYGAFPGEKVKKGQEIIASDTTRMDEEIKNMEEYIASMKEDYRKYMEKQTEALGTYRWEEERWGRDVKKLEGTKPARFVDEETGEPAAEGPGAVVNPEYTQWEADYELITGLYRINKHKADTIQLQMDQRTQLYELDLKHQEYLLKNKKADRKQATVVSEMDGELVAMRSLVSGDWIAAEQVVAAVGDPDRKLLKCEYINKATIRKAQDVYAMIDGKRYEVEYQAITNEEYTKLSANGEKVYSTFNLKDAGEEISVGDFAVITVVMDIRDDVVTVPKSAIQRDELGNFVYLVKDGQSIHTPIQTGYSDGVYTEVLSGVEEGDKVLHTPTMNPGSGEAVVERGEFHTDFSERGMMDYSTKYPLENPVENGTVYFAEYQVRKYQHVEKGDVIATIRVEPDRIALTRNETRLERIRERMADFQKLYEGHEEEEYYKDTMKNYQEQIQNLEKVIGEQKADFATTVIRADHTGVIVYLKDMKEEDILTRGARLAEIANEDTCYVLVQDSSQLLQYGNEVTITFQNEQQQEETAQGTVATMSKLGVSKSLQMDYSLILLSSGKIGSMLQTAEDGGWWNPYRYTVKARLRSAENVLIVPKNAVYDVGGKTYVYIKEENGKVKAQSFISGGYNDRYYWVLQGLTEGMEVCLK